MLEISLIIDFREYSVAIDNASGFGEVAAAATNLTLPRVNHKTDDLTQGFATKRFLVDRGGTLVDIMDCQFNTE